MDYSYHFTYSVDGKIKTAAGNNSDFALDISESGDRLKITLVPDRPLKVLDFFVERNYDFDEGMTFFANGFQSWTDTREFGYYDRMPGIGLVAKSPFGKVFGLKYVGDYTFVHDKAEPGSFHSHSFAYVRDGKKIDFFGSLDDSTGFTIIYANMPDGKVRFSKDVEGVQINEPYEILNMYFADGDYDSVFDDYFSALAIKPLTDKKIKGYTSWYNYYQNIDEKIILRDLGSLSEKKEYANTFQIDDGYQTAVGDWLSIDKNKFPSGMKHIADKIHSAGFDAGIWLAPFGAQKNSRLAAEHPDWLVCKNGKPIPVGANWGGFYALNIYNSEVRKYIKNVFDTVLNDWGFDLVKLDFLYAASIIPLNGKSRGKVAYDAVELLRECVGDKKILACGAVQMPYFGKVEYMRIGADMSLGWKHTLLRKNMHREDVSTPNAIHNSVYRRCLNGRAFLCDPDVFLLRRTNIKFTFEQQKALAKFIKLFGGVLFMSDNVGEYDSKQEEIFCDVMKDDSKLVAVNEKNAKLFIDYVQNKKAKVLAFSVDDGTVYQI